MKNTYSTATQKSKELSELIETEFDHVVEINGMQTFKKRK